MIARLADIHIFRNNFGTGVECRGPKLRKSPVRGVVIYVRTSATPPISPARGEVFSVGGELWFIT